MSVDGWFVEFVAADKAARQKLLQGKTKADLAKIAKYYKIPAKGNTTNLKNALVYGNLKLPL